MKEQRLPIKPLVLPPDTEDGCWEWQGKIHKNTGYGAKTFGGDNFLAHRWVWLMLLGPIPEGLVINHKCSNRKCVNPMHLEIVDQAGNCRHGEGAKLTQEQVIEIKKAKTNKRWGDGARLAKKYNVSGALIHDIWNGRAWAEVAAPMFKQHRAMLYCC